MKATLLTNEEELSMTGVELIASVLGHDSIMTLFKGESG